MGRDLILSILFPLVALCGCDNKRPVEKPTYSLDAGWYVTYRRDQAGGTESDEDKIGAVVRAGDEVTMLGHGRNDFPVTGRLDGNEFVAQMNEFGVTFYMVGTLTADNHMEGTFAVTSRDGKTENGTWGMRPADPTSVPPEPDSSGVDLEIEVWIMGYHGPIDSGKRILTATNYHWGDHEGLVRAKKKGKMGFIDKTGEVAIPFEFRTVWDFEEGLARVQSKDGNGFIDKKGDWVIGPFDVMERSLEDFSEGLAGYGVRTGWKQAGRGRVTVMTYGFINKKGDVVIKPQFDDVREFSEGLAPAKVKDRWGYVNPQGRLVIEPTYESAWRFSEGLANVKIGGKWGYVGHDGQFAIAPKYESASSFRNGEARVSSSPNALPTYIDRFGDYVRDAFPKELWERSRAHDSDSSDPPGE